MNEERSEQTGFKGFWKRNKVKICVLTGALAIGTIVVCKAAKNKKDTDIPQIENDGQRDEDNNLYGRDCLMTFTVEDTGEVLGDLRCTESYVNDMLDLKDQI